jgi:hypothetical protein
MLNVRSTSPSAARMLQPRLPKSDQNAVIMLHVWLRALNLPMFYRTCAESACRESTGSDCYYPDRQVAVSQAASESEIFYVGALITGGPPRKREPGVVGAEGLFIRHGRTSH